MSHTLTKGPPRAHETGVRRIVVVPVMALLAPALFGQVAVTGVVNAASWATPLEPGSVIAIFGNQLANTTAVATGYPLPARLAGTSVNVNGVAAPLYFVSPGQINAQLPWVPEYSMPPSASVVVAAPGGASPSFTVNQVFTAPGVFTADSSGCGQAAALNITPAGIVSVNSPSNSAQPGDYIAIFGSGFGQPVLPVADGVASPVMNIGAPNGISLGAGSQPLVTYDGLAPSLAGVDQINLQMPAGAQEGCSVPLIVGGIGYESPAVTVSVRTGRGRCVDPPPSFYGQVLLMKTAGAADTLTAIFPSGPDVQAPVPLVQNSYRNSGPALPLSRTCAVPGYTNLSAGAIGITGPDGTVATVLPQLQSIGVAYQANLPSGFLQAGKYTILAQPNEPVFFSAVMQLDPPIQLQTGFAAGTVLSASQGFTLQWTGGNPNDLVRVELVNVSPVSGNTFNTYVTTVGAGSIAIGGFCLGGNPLEGGGLCSWSIPLGSAQVIVDVMPPGGIAATSGATQISWDYRYIFNSLVLGN